MTEPNVELSHQQISRINKVLDGMKEHLPNYTELVKKVLYKNMYKGPLIMMPKNIPSELIIDILANLERQEVEKCQLINRRFCQYVCTLAEILPLRKFESLYFENREEEITAGVRIKDLETVELLKFDGGRFCHNDRYQHALTYAHLGTIRFINIRLATLAMEKFWIVMEKLVRAVGRKLSCGHIYSTLDNLLRFEFLELLTEEYVQVDKFEFDISTMPLDILKSSEILRRGFNAKKVIMRKDVKNIDHFMMLIANALLPDIEKYSIVLPAEDLAHVPGSFFNEWLKLMANQPDPTKLIPKITIARQIRGGINTTRFLKAILDAVRHRSKSIENDPKMTTSNATFHKAWHIYTVKKTATYELKVMFDHKDIRLKMANEDGLTIDGAKIIPEFIQSVDFVVQKL